mmetsp:Transcript_34352/g.74201  ORF Transcript_34352/g.74201 Transcript_34352/m.74201 type:complete len:96 (-) Transcript_34352:2126-2413(-)
MRSALELFLDPHQVQEVCQQSSPSMTSCVSDRWANGLIGLLMQERQIRGWHEWRAASPECLIEVAFLSLCAKAEKQKNPFLRTGSCPLTALATNS